MRNLFKKLFGKRHGGHLHSHAHVAEVYKCQCGHTVVKERR